MICIAIFGISGVGKTWLASRLAERRGMRHVQAGELLRLAKEDVEGRATTAEELRTGAVLDNQALLLQAFRRVGASEQRHIIFDGHSIVDTDAGLVEVPVAVIEGLNPCAIVFVKGEPREIAGRRSADSSRRRPLRSTEELAQHQALALTVCERYSAALGVPLIVVGSGDLDELDQVVTTITTGGRI